jgi:hypothetical protein
VNQGDPGEFFRLANAAKRDCRDQFLLQHAILAASGMESDEMS